jgi:FixJ family two-component response regulator
MVRVTCSDVGPAGYTSEHASMHAGTDLIGALGRLTTGNAVVNTTIERATVYVIDDVASVQRALSRLLRSVGFCPVACASVDEFFALGSYAKKGCVVADVHLGAEISLQLPELLRSRGLDLPVIFITAWDTPETRDRVRRSGAAAYFRKPVDDQALVDAIQWAFSGRNANDERNNGDTLA